MRIVHWYHVYADGDWEEPLREHLEALRPWKGQFVVCIVGAHDNREAVRQFCTDAQRKPDWGYGWDNGNEYLTLRKLHDWAQHHPDCGVLYAHTKGAYSNTPINRAWRRSLTHQLVANAASCARLLETHDLVGAHYLTKYDRPFDVLAPYFAGNFWWAQSNYLARLARPSDVNRYAAEWWVASGRNPTPDVVDVYPGFPADIVFGPEHHPPVFGGS